MKMIFNEHKYAEHLLKHGFSRFMSLQDLTILAKYYKEQGIANRKIKIKLIEFCESNYFEFNDVIHGGYIQTALKNAKKYDLRIPQPVMVTQKELDTIRELKDYKLEKIVFTIIVLAKFYKKCRISKKQRKENDNYYVNLKMTDILKAAKVYINKSERYAIQHKLYTLGIWEATYYGSFKINCIDTTGSGILLVDVEEDLAEQYAKYKKDCGMETNIRVKCVDCGEFFDRRGANSTKQVRCEKCTDLRKKERDKKKSKKYYLKIKNNLLP